MELSRLRAGLAMWPTKAYVDRSRIERGDSQHLEGRPMGAPLEMVAWSQPIARRTT
jgi:hypothetical protein